MLGPKKAGEDFCDNIRVGIYHYSLVGLRPNVTPPGLPAELSTPISFPDNHRRSIAK
jgi:hypothetical protein